jgi:transposase
MKAIQIPPLNETQRAELDELFHKTQLPRLRSRAQMVLLSAEQGLKAPAIAAIVRESDDSVARWLKRYLANGVAGLYDAPRSGRPAKVTASFRAEVVKAVRRRPRSLDLPFSLWTLQRLIDYMAERSGTRVSPESMRQGLMKEGIVLSRPQHKVSSPDPDYLLKKRRLK